MLDSLKKIFILKLIIKLTKKIMFYIINPTSKVNIIRNK